MREEFVGVGSRRELRFKMNARGRYSGPDLFRLARLRRLVEWA